MRKRELRFGRCHSGLRQDLKHLIGRVAQARAFGRHHDGALDQNGVRNHEIDKLVIGPLPSPRPSSS